MGDNDTNVNNRSDHNTAEEKLVEQTRERKEYMTKLRKWLDDARLWHYGLCSRIPANNVPGSNFNIMDSILRQYTTLSQTNMLHQHFQNVLLNTYSNNLNRTTQNSGFMASRFICLFYFSLFYLYPIL